MREGTTFLLRLLRWWNLTFPPSLGWWQPSRIPPRKLSRKLRGTIPWQNQVILSKNCAVFLTVFVAMYVALRSMFWITVQIKHANLTFKEYGVVDKTNRYSYFGRSRRGSSTISWRWAVRSAPCRNQAHHFDKRLLEHHVGGSARVSLNASFTAEPPRRAALGGQTTESLVAWLLELHIDEGCTVVDPQWPTSHRSFHSYTHVHPDTHSQSMRRLFPQLHVQAGPPPRNVAGSSHSTRKKNFVQRVTLFSLLLGLAATKCACHDTSNSGICVRCSHVFLPCFQDVICLRATNSLPRVGKSTAGFPHTDYSCLRLVDNLLEVKMSQRGIENTYSLVTQWQQ